MITKLKNFLIKSKKFKLAITTYVLVMMMSVSAFATPTINPPDLTTADSGSIITFLKDLAIAALDFPLALLQWVFSNVFIATLFCLFIAFALLLKTKRFIPGMK